MKFAFLVNDYGYLRESFTLEGDSLDDPKLREKLAEILLTINDGSYDWYDELSDTENLDSAIPYWLSVYEVSEPIPMRGIYRDMKNLNDRWEAEDKARREEQDKLNRKMQYERLKEEFEGE